MVVEIVGLVLLVALVQDVAQRAGSRCSRCWWWSTMPSGGGCLRWADWSRTWSRTTRSDGCGCCCWPALPWVCGTPSQPNSTAAGSICLIRLSSGSSTRIGLSSSMTRRRCSPAGCRSQPLHRHRPSSLRVQKPRLTTAAEYACTAPAIMQNASEGHGRARSRLKSQLRTARSSEPPRKSVCSTCYSTFKKLDIQKISPSAAVRYVGPAPRTAGRGRPSHSAPSPGSESGRPAGRAPAAG